LGSKHTWGGLGLGWGAWRAVGAQAAFRGAGTVACHGGTHKPGAGLPTSHALPPCRQLFFTLPSCWRSPVELPPSPSTGLRQAGAEPVAPGLPKTFPASCRCQRDRRPHRASLPHGCSTLEEGELNLSWRPTHLMRASAAPRQQGALGAPASVAARAARSNGARPRYRPGPACTSRGMAAQPHFPHSSRP